MAASDIFTVQQDKPLTVSAARLAVMLGVAKRTVDRWVAAGTIPSRKQGERRLFVVSEIEAWLASLPSGSTKRETTAA